MRTAACITRSASRCAARNSPVLGGCQLLAADRRLLGGGQLVEPAHQLVGAAAAHGDRGDHRHAQLGRQPVEIDLDAAPARDVDHVEHQQQRPADLLQLESPGASASRRLVASATQTSRSGAASLAKRPSTTSRVISSSGLRARSE